MANPANIDDANLILRLYELRREDKMRTARAWYAKNFRPQTLEEFNQIVPPGTDENAHMRQVTSYFEMVASFVNAGILNKDLYFQSGGELLLTFLRLRPILADLRASAGLPHMYANLEALSNEFLDFYESKGPGAREAIIKRLS
jgi:hypothetical protein